MMELTLQVLEEAGADIAGVGLRRTGSLSYSGGGKLQQTESWWPSRRGYKRLRTENRGTSGIWLENEKRFGRWEYL